MASTKEEAVVAASTPKKAESPVAAPVESIYSAAELAENHKLFNTSYEIVVVALRKAGKKTATFAEAKKIIEKFKNREVK